jgi:hypothetical protein
VPQGPQLMHVCSSLQVPRKDRVTHYPSAADWQLLGQTKADLMWVTMAGLLPLSCATLLPPHGKTVPCRLSNCALLDLKLIPTEV